MPDCGCEPLQHLTYGPSPKQGEDPVADEPLTWTSLETERILCNQGWEHLPFRVDGKSLIIYSGRPKTPSLERAWSPSPKPLVSRQAIFPWSAGTQDIFWHP